MCHGRLHEIKRIKGLLACVIMMYRVEKLTRNYVYIYIYIKGSMILSLYTYFTNLDFPGIATEIPHIPKTLYVWRISLHLPL